MGHLKSLVRSVVERYKTHGLTRGRTLSIQQTAGHAANHRRTHNMPSLSLVGTSRTNPRVPETFANSYHQDTAHSLFFILASLSLRPTLSPSRPSLKRHGPFLLPIPPPITQNTICQCQCVPPQETCRPTLHTAYTDPSQVWTSF